MSPGEAFAGYPSSDGRSAVSVLARQRLRGWTTDLEGRERCRIQPTQRLMAETNRRMLRPARSVGCHLRPIGVSRPPRGRVRETIATDTGPWLLVDYRDDPVVQQRGDLPVPPTVLTDLKRLRKTTFDPDLILIGHQQKPGWLDGDPIAPVPAPRHLRELDERIRQRLEFGSELLFRGLGGLLLIAASPLALGAVIFSGSGGVGLDPIVIGGVAHPELPLIEWVMICKWSYE